VCVSVGGSALSLSLIVSLPGMTAVYHKDVVIDSDSEAVPEGPHLGQLAIDLNKITFQTKGPKKVCICVSVCLRVRLLLSLSLSFSF